MADARGGTGSPRGFLARIGSGLSRLFGAPRHGAGVAGIPLEECAFELAARGEELFSVFPAWSGGEDEEPASQSFCVHLARAFDYRVRQPLTPIVVGLLGAGGCGKSTLFNELVGAAASRVDILPHTTRGPVAATGPATAASGLLAPLAVRALDPARPARGDLDSLLLARAEGFPYPGMVLVDLPDLNTQTAREEGTLTATLLPWLDGALLVYSVESFDRAVLDRTLEYLGPLRTRLAVVFNRKGSRGPVAAGDRKDLDARTEALGAAGPFFLPDLRDPRPEADGRGALRETLASMAAAHGAAERLQGLRATLLHLGRMALDRQARQAGKAKAARRRFAGHVKGLRKRIELDPMAAVSRDPREIGLLLHDLQGLIGNPMELFRRLRRGQPLGTALHRTFNLEARVGELEEAVQRMQGVEPEVYVERLRRHFGNVASGLSHTYATAVSEEPDLFLERRCAHDLVGRLFDDRVAVIAHGFETFRDETVRYMGDLRERIRSTGGLEATLTVLAYASLVGDVFFFPGTSVAMVGGGWILVQVLGSDFQPILRRHREFRQRQRAGLDRAFGLLAAALEDHFLTGEHHFGRLRVLEAGDRERLGSLLDRIEELPLPVEEGEG